MSNDQLSKLINNRSRLFLISINNSNEIKNFNKSIEQKIWINEEKLLAVWGLRSTNANQQIWTRVRSADYMLFSNRNQCFAKAKIHTTERNSKISSVSKSVCYLIHTQLYALFVLGILGIGRQQVACTQVMRSILSKLCTGYPHSETNIGYGTLTGEKLNRIEELCKEALEGR